MTECVSRLGPKTISVIASVSEAIQNVLRRYLISETPPQIDEVVSAPTVQTGLSPLDCFADARNDGVCVALLLPTLSDVIPG